MVSASCTRRPPPDVAVVKIEKENKHAMEPSELRRIGKKFVAEWLQNSGHVANLDTILPELDDLELDHPSSKMLVEVRTTIFPEIPKDLNPDEVRNLRARAAKAGRKAYAARVLVNPAGQLLQEVQWQRLPVDLPERKPLAGKPVPGNL